MNYPFLNKTHMVYPARISAVILICILIVYVLVYILIFTHLIYKEPSSYITLYILWSTRFSIAQWGFILHLHFSNQIKFDLKSMNEEFLQVRNSRVTKSSYEIKLRHTSSKWLKKVLQKFFFRNTYSNS